MTLRQRQPRVEDPAFLAYLRRQRCCACGAPPRVQAAHLRMGSLAHDKRPTGTGEKPSDCWATPLCQECHLDGPQAQHRLGERRFWTLVGLDPFELALSHRRAFEAMTDLASGAPYKVRQRVRAPHKSQPASDSRPKVGRPKVKWPSRPFQSASRWPQGRGFR